MTLEPFVAAGGTPFTATADDVRQRRGAPWRSGRNGVELDELDYGDAVYRFQASGRLEEITMDASVLRIGNLSVPFASLSAFVREHDAQAFWRARFLVSPKFGIAFDPAEPHWVTALARHCLPEWEKL